mmetsp:Transcript_9953/g.21893  ORF Transcript_9953/g.21893 Transcript_9953/m.21893 type:complete len:132 (+) Transcript_9953:106-501(+)
MGSASSKQDSSGEPLLADLPPLPALTPLTQDEVSKLPVTAALAKLDELKQRNEQAQEMSQSIKLELDELTVSLKARQNGRRDTSKFAKCSVNDLSKRVTMLTARDAELSKLLEASQKELNALKARAASSSK